MNTKIQTLTQQLETKQQAIINLINNLVFDDIIAKVNFRYDGISVSLSHKTLNWTEFVTATYEASRWEENGYKFKFSHGSGGWNDGPTSEILKATINIFNITNKLQTFLPTIEKNIIEVVKMENELTKLYQDMRHLEAANKEAQVELELKEKYPEISYDDVIKTLREDGFIKVETVNGVYDMQNRGTNKISIYINGYHYTQKQIANKLNKPLYIVQD